MIVRLLLPCLFLATACQTVSSPLDEAPFHLTTSESAGLLAFVNHRETTFSVLDKDVGLDRRAANSIVEHKTGPDGVVGTNDDALFTTLEELDAAYYVGETALLALYEYALAEGWISNTPMTVEGVSFTPAEAAAVVQTANTFTASQLKTDVGLYANAITHLVDARPFSTVLEIADTPFIGPSSLTKLKQFSQAVSEDCLVISEYMEGGGNNNKVVEIFNCGQTTISLQDYNLCLVRNDDTSCTTAESFNEFELAAGEVFVTCRTTGGTFLDPIEPVKENCHQEMPSVMTFNGDDRLALRKGQHIVDALGEIAIRPAYYPWRDVILRRCNFTPYPGTGQFNEDRYTAALSRYDGSDLGLAPTADCP